MIRDYRTIKLDYFGRKMKKQLFRDSPGMYPKFFVVFFGRYIQVEYKLGKWVWANEETRENNPEN